MSQVVGSEILDPCIFHGLDEHLFQFAGVYDVSDVVEEDTTVAVDRSHLYPLFQQFKNSVIDGHGPCLPGLFPRGGYGLPEKVYVLPLQLEDLLLAHAGVQCKDDDVFELSVEPAFKAMQ